jgi:hypothetical protein
MVNVQNDPNFEISGEYVPGVIIEDEQISFQLLGESLKA